MHRTEKSAVKSAAHAALFICACAQAQPDTEFIDELLGDYPGCVLLITQDRHRQERLEYGPDHCQNPQSPCSTYKIPHALIGLQTGVVEGPDELKMWDGQQRAIASHNRDHTLASAVQHSAVWYFQELAADIGETDSKFWLETLDYGNRDLSGGLDQYWLESSLEITPLEQMNFIRQLHHGTLPVRPVHQQQVRSMLMQESELPGQLSGKTGSCRGEPDHGWFIGWIDWDTSPKNPATTWFVTSISGPEAWGTKARAITLELLQNVNPINGDTHGTP